MGEIDLGHLVDPDGKADLPTAAADGSPLLALLLEGGPHRGAELTEEQLPDVERRGSEDFEGKTEKVQLRQNGSEVG